MRAVWVLLHLIILLRHLGLQSLRLVGTVGAVMCEELILTMVAEVVKSASQVLYHRAIPSLIFIEFSFSLCH